MTTINNILEFKKELEDMGNHVTFEDFDKFDTLQSIFGLHFGTEESAINRIAVKKEENRRIGIPLPHSGENPFLFKVKLNVKNPLTLNESRGGGGGWTPFEVLRCVMEQHSTIGVAGVTNKEYDDWGEDELEFNGLKLIDLDDEDYEGEYKLDVKEHLFIRNWLESKGYDSIKYHNEFETGGNSIIVFRNEQVEIKEKIQLNPDFKPKNNRRIKHT
jgi:hypothetical protein